MNFFERRKVLRDINSMDLVPVRARGHEMEGERVIVLIPKFEASFYRWFVPSTQKLFFKIKLDALGSLAWLSMDGQRNVQQICDILGSSQISRGEDMEERVPKFVMDLYSKGMITFKQLLNE